MVPGSHPRPHQLDKLQYLSLTFLNIVVNHEVGNELSSRCSALQDAVPGVPEVFHGVVVEVKAILDAFQNLVRQKDFDENSDQKGDIGRLLLCPFQIMPVSL